MSDYIFDMGMIPQMRHKHFSQFWGTDVDSFISDLKGSGIPLLISENTARTAYWLLLAEYANSTIANADETQFKNKLYATIFKYAPTWEKRMEIQQKLREMSEEEIAQGAKQILNKAEHPGTLPSTASLEELQMISEQNVASNKRDKLTGYNHLLALLEVDVTSEFLDKFKRLFMTVVAPERPLLYKNLLEDEK